MSRRGYIEMRYHVRSLKADRVAAASLGGSKHCSYPDQTRDPARSRRCGDRPPDVTFLRVLQDLQRLRMHRKLLLTIDTPMPSGVIPSIDLVHDFRLAPSVEPLPTDD